MRMRSNETKLRDRRRERKFSSQQLNDSTSQFLFTPGGGSLQRLVRRLFSLEHKTAEEMRGRVAINLLRGFCFRDFEQSHPSCFTPGEVESLRCEITVRCVGAGVCGFDGDVQ